MPYETGTATNLQDLLNKLGTFAGANGWTVHFSGARTGGAGTSGHALILSRGDVQGLLRSNNSAGSPTTDPGPYMEGVLWSGAYNAASTESQPNPSAALFTNWMAGPYVAYHAFTPLAATGRHYLHVVVEVQSGTFRHFGIGQLRRFGSYTNGTYAHGTSMSFNTSPAYINTANSFHGYPFNNIANGTAPGGGVTIRADFDGVSPRYCTVGSSGTVGRVWSGFVQSSNAPSGNFGTLALAGPSAFTGRAPLLPLLCFVQRDTTDQLRHPVGFPEDLRYVSIDNFQPGDTITLGADTWMLFPAVRKGAANTGPVGVQNSWRYGYAYRLNA